MVSSGSTKGRQASPGGHDPPQVPVPGFLLQVSIVVVVVVVSIVDVVGTMIVVHSHSPNRKMTRHV